MSLSATPTHSSPIRIILCGAGPLGQQILHHLLQRPSLQLVGIIDIDPALQGKSVNELIGTGPDSICVANSLHQVLRQQQADICLIATVSDLKSLAPQALQAMEMGLAVISTCEELSYPWHTDPDLAQQLDTAARKAGVALLGTGVNPGFLMDFLPQTMTAVCQHVECITVQRYQNASTRRIPFQKKIGAALTPEQFESAKKQGSLRHVGLEQSIEMIAGQMGWQLDRIEEDLEPILAEQSVDSVFGLISPGMAIGLRQTARGLQQGKERVLLDFRAAIGHENVDRISVHGVPDIISEIQGGVQGDLATCAITLNACSAVLRSNPGLRTMTDIPTPCWSS